MCARRREGGRGGEHCTQGGRTVEEHQDGRRRGGPTTEETPVTTANIDRGYTRVDSELAIHL